MKHVILRKLISVFSIVETWSEDTTFNEQVLQGSKTHHLITVRQS